VRSCRRYTLHYSLKVYLHGGVALCPHGVWGRDPRLPGWIVRSIFK
jgi:hypothetical protein